MSSLNILSKEKNPVFTIFVINRVDVDLACA